MHIKFILVSLSILCLIGCKGIPNNEVFEAYAEIKIPGTVHVTRDTVMENVQDFWKTLEFTIDQDSKRELINSVLGSKFINDKIYNDSTLVRPETLKKVDDKEGIWYRVKHGYSFYGTANKGRVVISGEIDTVRMKVKFNCSSD